MRFERSIRWIHALLATAAFAGCRGVEHLNYLGDADLQYYKTKSLEIEYPNVDDPTPPEVAYSQAPRTVKDAEVESYWDLSLQDAVLMAVANNKMIRTRGEFLNGGTLLRNPTNAPSVYDPALRETGFLFGNRGVEAALADFDAQFTTSLLFGSSQNVQNNGGFINPGFVLQNDTAQFNSQLQKQFANGGTVAVSHNWNYLNTNSPAPLLFPSSYNGLAGFSYTQPLWAGSGVDYTRIAGPPRQGLGGLLGVNQGVTISRINVDISLADFELSVIQMTKDVEDLYWELYLTYRQYDAEVANRDSVLTAWKTINFRRLEGAKGGGSASESLARANYLETRARVENTLATIYSTENQFRRLLGLPVNDGRLIRPIDSPLQAEYVVNWDAALLDSLMRRPELRRQKWQIKSLELQRMAAESVVNPQLNFVSSYQLNGFGDDLWSYDTSGNNSAYGSLTRGEQSSWTLGFQFAMPIGFRQARSQLRNIELQLIKAKAALTTQEQDISHELADAVQRVDAAYMVAKTNFDRVIAAEKQLEGIQLAFDLGGAELPGIGPVNIDLLTRTQANRAAAEVAFVTSVVRYNQAIAELHLRQGTTLENSGISLEEGPWSEGAQDDALRRAWARSFARPNDRLETQPPEFSSPVPYPKTDLFPSSANSGHQTPTPAVPPGPADAAYPPAVPAPAAPGVESIPE